MDAASQPQDSGPVRRRRRRHEPKGWKAVPKKVFIIVGVCLAVLVLIPVVRDLTRRAPAPPAASASRQSTALLLNETRYDDSSRRIVGVVGNPSATAYQNVVVSYNIINDQGAEMGAVVAIIDRMAPNSSAPFATDPLPPGVRRYVLREVTGTPK